jgi:hypothetical protein
MRKRCGACERSDEKTNIKVRSTRSRGADEPLARPQRQFRLGTALEASVAVVWAAKPFTQLCLWTRKSLNDYREILNKPGQVLHTATPLRSNLRSERNPEGKLWSRPSAPSPSPKHRKIWFTHHSKLQIINGTDRYQVVSG